MIRATGVRVCHITPGLPPAPEGVGDYAVLLGRRLRELSDGAITSSFIAAGHTRREPPDPTLDATDLTGRTSQADLVAAVEDAAAGGSPIVLHYVGYGFARRGAPLWLLRAVRRLRDRVPGGRIVTVFHELYATGRPWQSAFWLAPIQRHVAVGLARTSDGVFTNRRVAADWLRRVRSRTEAGAVSWSPVFSNVGEPDTVAPWAERDPVAVVFGGAATRSRTLDGREPELAAALDALEIESLWEIGPPRAGAPGTFLGRSVEALGVLPAAEVGARLERVRVGLLRYPLAFITKSGVMSAYLSHGVPPILLDGGPPVPDMAEGVAYLRPGAATPEAAERCGRTGLAWYRDHAHSEIAARRLLPLVAGDGVVSP